MNALIVYESMFGNTRQIAESIAGSLESTGASVTLAAAADAPTVITGYELVVVGAPTHAHTLPQAASRSQGAAWGDDPERALTLEVSATKSGVREWLERVEFAERVPRFVAFSTRVDIARIFAGDAAAGIARRLHRRHVEVEAHEDFLVDRDSHLLVGETQRAADWASQLVPVASG
jgi:menaquinone-dependent protoporphyrinogen IX oxidase